MDYGWIKLHRKTLENPITRKPNYLALWVTLLLKANHKENSMIWNGDTIIIKEGQFITGRKQLSIDTGIAESTIEDILKYLEKQQQIQQQKTTKFRLITIVNWKTHQEDDRKSNNRATTEQQQSNTNKNDNNVKNNNATALRASRVTKKQIPQTTEAGITRIIKLFEDIDLKNKEYYSQASQRNACIFLMENYGLEEVLNLIPRLKETNKTSFYQITTPFEMKKNIVKVFNDTQRKKVEVKSKGRGLA